MRGAEGEERREREEVLTRPPFLGHGLGLRREHYAAILAGESAGDWVEAISENYMEVGGRARRILLAVRERYPMTLHGVSLGIGGTDPLDESYLSSLRALADDVEPAFLSDHLCWTGVEGRTSHDLLPLPYTEEALAHVVARVAHAQERLGRPLALENVSSYVGWRVSGMTEWEFVAEVARRSGCGLLLDVNNVYVAATNHGLDPRAYLAAIPPRSVWQLHLAGPSEAGCLLVDTHDHPVRPEVWDLYREAVRRFGPVSTIVEWDDRIPDLAVVRSERDKAAALAAEELAGEAACAASAHVAQPGSGPTGSLSPAVVATAEDGTDPAGGPGRPDRRRIENQDLTPLPLREGQRLFLDLVTAPESVAATLEQRGERARERVEAVFAGDGRLSGVERLDVYANMYFFRLKDVLGEDFARTATALGEARWHNLVTDYLVAHPPTRWSLRWAGERLPGFLRGHALGEERPWLADVAALEWARNEAFQARDAEGRPAEALAELPADAWPEVRFDAPPGTSVLETRWDLAAWWAGAPAGEPRPAGAAQDLLVWRDADDDVRHEALPAADAQAARLLLSGAGLARICEAWADVVADEEEAARRAVDLVVRLRAMPRAA